MDELYISVTSEQKTALRYLAKLPPRATMSYLVLDAIQKYIVQRRHELPRDMTVFFTGGERDDVQLPDTKVDSVSLDNQPA